MGYLVDGAFLAACIGAYRVYTDRRKSILSSQWNNYRLFWINLGRHSVDFAAATLFDVATSYPGPVRSMMTQAKELVPSATGTITNFHQGLLKRAGRYRVWSRYGRLGYLQRIILLGSQEESLFGQCHPWRLNLQYTAPHLLGYVKDRSAREYLETLSNMRDGYAGIIEGSPSKIAALVNNAKSMKKDIIQDVRKGHIFDRKSETSVSIVHELRMEIEGYLFGVSGPDPDRSSYIEKCLSDEHEGMIERLFPFLEVIVDTSGETLRLNGKGSLNDIAPNVDVFVPNLRLAGEIVAVGLGGDEFVVCPLNKDLLFNGSSHASIFEEGAVVEIAHAKEPSTAITGKVSGRYGEAIKIVISGQ